MALSLVVLVPVGAAPAGGDAAKKDLEKMQGVWRLVRGEAEGEAASDYVVENLEVAVQGDRLTFKGIAPLTDRAARLTVTLLDPATTPRCIDLKVDAGSLKGSVLEGVYDWQDGELKLCLLLTGERRRPLEFEAGAGSNRVLFVLKRQP
jgi:uncharacterized protein (TIGR03067 family)